MIEWLNLNQAKDQVIDFHLLTVTHFLFFNLVSGHQPIVDICFQFPDCFHIVSFQQLFSLSHWVLYWFYSLILILEPLCPLQKFSMCFYFLSVVNLLCVTMSLVVELLYFLTVFLNWYWKLISWLLSSCSCRRLERNPTWVRSRESADTTAHRYGFTDIRGLSEQLRLCSL